MFAIQIINGSRPFCVDFHGDILTFETGADAGKRAGDLNSDARNAGDAVRYRVVPHKAPDCGPAEDWRARELSRLAGEYKRVPWHWEDWFTGSPLFSLHFAHVSTEKDGMVAFTESEEKGAADRQIRMRPGRYLERFFSDVLTPHQIREWAAKFATENESPDVKFARTAEEIEDVYTSGPSSCMAHSASDYNSPFHPVRVYAGPDLAVAYIERDGAITARAVVWPEKLVYTRIYGDEDRLESALVAMGYGSGSLTGARITRHMYDDRYVIPYIDHQYRCDDNGKFLVIGHGDIGCQETTGLSEESGYSCDNCGDHVDEDDTYSVDGGDARWCEHCVSNYGHTCNDCGDVCSGAAHLTTARGYDICEGCADNYSFCEHCSEYHASDRVEEDCDGNPVCRDCAADMDRAHCGLVQPDGCECGCEECEDHRAAQAADASAEEEREAASSAPRQLDLDSAA